MASRAVDTRARRYDPAETRARVLSAANMLFATKGFTATGTADIAREADVSEGSIFYHFGSKKNLLTELGRRYGEAMIAAMQRDDALADLEPGIIISRVFSFCEENKIWDAIGDDGRSNPETPHTKNPEAEPFYHAATDTTTAWITQQMTVAGARRGVTGINIPIAASFICHIVGDAMRTLIDVESAQSRDAIKAETVRFVRAACGYAACGREGASLPA